MDFMRMAFGKMNSWLYDKYRASCRAVRGRHVEPVRRRVVNSAAQQNDIVWQREGGLGPGDRGEGRGRETAGIGVQPERRDEPRLPKTGKEAEVVGVSRPPVHLVRQQDLLNVIRHYIKP